MKILDSEIQRFFNTKNWKIALRYHDQDVVDEIVIKESIPGFLYEINAVVNVYGYENHCTVLLNSAGEILDFSCECPYCEQQELACGHIGVVLLIVYDLKPESFPFTYSPLNQREDAFRRYLEQQMLERSRSFIDRYARKELAKFQANTLLDKVQLHAHAAYDHEFTLDFKIGIQRKYVIRSISGFLDAIDRQLEVDYGRQLKFTHHMQAFDEAAQAQINFLKQYVKEHETQYSYGYGSSRKQITIDSKSMDDFYELYSNDATECIDLQFADEDRQEIGLRIDMQEDFFVITTLLSLDQLLRGENRWYYMEDGVLQRFSSVLSEQLHDMLEELREDRQILIHKDDMIRFCTYVIPAIREYVHFEGISLDTFMPYPMEIDCYVDLEDNGDISIRLLYHYEDSPSQNAFAPHADSSLELDHIRQYIETYATRLDPDSHIAYIDEHAVYAQAFVKQGLEYLNQMCTVYISDALKQMEAPKKVHMNVGVRMKNRLLELDVTSVDIPRDELYSVLRSYRKKKKYHRLKNGDLIYLQSEGLQETDELLQQLHLTPQDLKNHTLQVDTFHAFQLDDFAEHSDHVEVMRGTAFHTMMEQLRSVEAGAYPLNPHYDAILRDYQKTGYQWLKTMSAYGFGGILADDMGLGKTLQVIAWLESMHQDHDLPCSIVICPASLIYNWKDEIQKFAVDLRALCIQGTNTQRQQKIRELHGYDVIITSYDYLRRDYERYDGHTFTAILLDEAQYIKNHTTKNAIAVKQLKGSYRFALTGTPIENSLSELWSIFDFLMPGYLYNYHRFRELFEREIIKNGNEKAQTQLKRMVEPFILRRIKKDVLQDLPDKMEQVYFQEFNAEEKKIYYANLVSINQDLQKKMQMEEVDKFQVLAMMTRLREICCDARLLYENVTLPSTKLRGCMDLLLNARNSGRRVLLFSSFTSMLELIEEQLRVENIRYLKLTGETKKELRHAYVEKFQNGEADVFLISLKAGGTGLNLTNAEIVIHYDPWWNLSAQNQATDRAYRIGQTKDVQVYKLIMKDTIEEKIMKLQERKHILSDTFISSSESSITSMSKDEIMDLFTMEPFVQEADFDEAYAD